MKREAGGKVEDGVWDKSGIFRFVFRADFTTEAQRGRGGHREEMGKMGKKWEEELPSPQCSPFFSVPL